MSWEHIRKDDYQYKLIRMVDDYLVDNEIGFGYKDYFERSECSYNGSFSSELYVGFYFRPKHRKMSKMEQSNLIKKVFPMVPNTQTIQNGIKVTFNTIGRNKRNGDYDLDGIHFTTTKEWIDEEVK